MSTSENAAIVTQCQSAAALMDVGIEGLAVTRRWLAGFGMLMGSIT